MSEIFTPPSYLRSAFVQTSLAGIRIRKWGDHPLLSTSQEVIPSPIEDVRLQGFYSTQSNRRARGLVMLLHGWEGSANSAYILRTGSFLYNHGYDVFRLNYRDHGDSHHLNSGLFLATLLDEVFVAVQQVSVYDENLPFYIVGFSMGGNFALRIARECAESPIGNLSKVVSISPVLDPGKSTTAIDSVYLLRRYFLKKWRLSLQKKQACFPNLYDFKEVLSLGTIAEMTDLMIERYSNYENASDYFNHYALLNDALQDIPVHTTIIAAKDDPIIPIGDFYDLERNPLTDLIVHRYGGHIGFFETLSGRAWYEKKILELFSTK